MEAGHRDAHAVVSADALHLGQLRVGRRRGRQLLRPGPAAPHADVHDALVRVCAPPVSRGGARDRAAARDAPSTLASTSRSACSTLLMLPTSCTGDHGSSAVSTDTSTSAQLLRISWMLSPFLPISTPSSSVGTNTCKHTCIPATRFATSSMSTAPPRSDSKRTTHVTFR